MTNYKITISNMLINEMIGDNDVLSMFMMNRICYEVCGIILSHNTSVGADIAKPKLRSSLRT